MSMIRVLARGGCLVLDLEFTEQTGRRKYVGRSEVYSHKLEDLPEGEPRHVHYNQFLERGNDTPIPHAAFPKLSEPVTVPARKEYTKAVRTGSLWPADAETAVICGCEFDPTFGGEYAAKE